MIGKLRGLAESVGADGRVLLDVAGVGYDVLVPVTTALGLPRPPEPASLLVHTAVTDDAITLYGFVDVDELSTFRALIKVPRLGPRTAWSILSHVDAGELRATVGAGDADRLARIRGIGGKTALRLVTELQKVFESDAVPQSDRLGQRGDAIEALVALGYKRRAAAKAVDDVIKSTDGPIELEDWIRRALQNG